MKESAFLRLSQDSLFNQQHPDRFTRLAAFV